MPARAPEQPYCLFVHYTMDAQASPQSPVGIPQVPKGVFLCVGVDPGHAKEETPVARRLLDPKVKDSNPTSVKSLLREGRRGDPGTRGLASSGAQRGADSGSKTVPCGQCLQKTVAAHTGHSPEVRGFLFFGICAQTHPPLDRVASECAKAQKAGKGPAQDS